MHIPSPSNNFDLNTLHRVQVPFSVLEVWRKYETRSYYAV